MGLTKCVRLHGKQFRLQIISYSLTSAVSHGGVWGLRGLSGSDTPTCFRLKQPDIKL